MPDEHSPICKKGQKKLTIWQLPALPGVCTTTTIVLKELTIVFRIRGTSDLPCYVPEGLILFVGTLGHRMLNNL